MSDPFELPQIEPDSLERADAARNRERILCAARRLFTERGAGCVSMDEIAEAAGVGKGTLFRRFGSRASLAAAVLSERERGFQEDIIRGEPPLGPGAPADERLIAFGEALLDTLELHSELLLAAETGPVRYTHPAYRVHRLHVMLLLQEADPGCDAEMLAEALLAALGAELFIHQRRAREIPLERMKQGWRELVRRTVPRAEPEPV
ncbi:MAG TPA: helix-turn-helix domain-containing protein [Solirubrobacteraceae bacterium]|jgi:AcrR family transcriptional regulator|nr:helix-turn-helix domain-containing protein [Solirubrobacteraceae bacterium]